MRLWRRSKDEGALTFTAAAEPPWAAVCFAVVFLLFAALTLAGVDLPLGVKAVPLLLVIPVGAALVLSWVVGRRTTKGNVDVFDTDDGRELRLFDGRQAEGIRLSELASVSREQEGEAPALTLTDLRGASVTIPLGIWANEDRLLELIELAMKDTGASGTVGPSVPVHTPAWIMPVRIAGVLVSGVSLLVLLDGLPPRGGERVERVTPGRIEETRGRTTQPFAGSRPCNVYVVPMDRPSEERANDVSRSLAQRLSLVPCAMPSFAIDVQALDSAREQLDAPFLAGKLSEQFLAVWDDRPSAVIGITEHDQFSSGDPGLRFVFGSAFRNNLQGFAAISTARMGSGEGRQRRLETMAMRYVGLYYFGLELSSDRSSALYHTIRSRGDLDRMRPEFSDPPPSDIDLRAARARYLASG